MKTLLIALVATCLIPLLSAFCEETDCSKQYRDIPIDKTTASAGFFANYWERDGSVRVESKKIFHKAQARSLALVQPDDFCRHGCRLRKIPYMYFESTPTAYQKDSDDSAYCQKKLESTTSTPITFETSSIKSVEDLSDWIGELSQGKGEYGEALYNECDRSCSPQYHYFVTKNSVHDENYQVHTQIMCGAERDKDSDQYHLRALFRWRCVEA